MASVALKDLTGQVFGYLTVIREVERSYRWGTSKRQWLCKCKCGQEVVKLQDALLKDKSCGCSQTKWMADRIRKHGATAGEERASEYKIWSGIRHRCLCPTSKYFGNYGERGIEICARWDDFEAFYADMGPRPSPAHSIERKDNDGPYSPDNCVWATRTTQNRNQRRNLMTPFNEGYAAVADIAEVKGLNGHNYGKALRNKGLIVKRGELAASAQVYSLQEVRQIIGGVNAAKRAADAAAN